MKVTLCITVFNEQTHIKKLLESIASQTQMPDEIVIVDGGSTDETKLLITNYELGVSNVKVITKKGNRAVGRNEAIKQATGDVIAITDAGCELDSHWLREITKPFVNTKTEVVSGYYAGRPTNVFQECLVPYVLVMPDKVNPSHFLPATRSMAMRKQIWKELGGFSEKYRWNEDYVFSKLLEKKHISIVFVQKAVVYWYPRQTVLAAWRMFYGFARGDTQAGIYRPKVMMLLFRVCIGIYLVIVLSWILLGGLAALYSFWAIWKNYRYIQKPMAFLYLPLLQITSDTAVFLGTVVGFFERIRKL